MVDIDTKVFLSWGKRHLIFVCYLPAILVFFLSLYLLNFSGFRKIDISRFIFFSQLTNFINYFTPLV